MPLSPATLQLLAHPLALCNMARRIAQEAGERTLVYFDEGGIAPEMKPDGSPVTRADREAEAIILSGLAAITPDIPVIAEESAAAGNIPDLTGASYFWLVDPLDGTKGFVRGSPDYTVNIALIHNGEPVLGVVYAPAHGEVYAGTRESGAVRWRAENGHEKPIHVRAMPREGLTVITSHSQGSKIDSILAAFKIAKTQRRGSSLKFCLIAAGKADLYPRPGKICEWDTAAGDAILRAAGGAVVDMAGAPLHYGHPERHFITSEFVASSGFWPVATEP